ncbi:MAG TPA: AAA family ATPase [Polyangiaceae bacterium]|nr:AAA family ATPase [Polyangiaceae bacterium]
MIYGFGDYEWDEELFELRSGNETIAAAPRVLETIGYLIRNRARTVTKEQLRQNVWKGTAVVDGALNQTIMLARKALRDEGEGQSVIKTIRGVGFRFVAPVRERSSRTDERQLDPPRVRTAAEDQLLGRDQELLLLRTRLARARDGQGSLVLIEGEPGIGKTSLVSALSHEAELASADVFWGRAWEEGGAPAFWPWTQVLRAMARRFGAERLHALLGPADAVLLPLLSQSAALGEDAKTTEKLNTSEASERFRLFDAMSRFLRSAADGVRAHGSSTREPLIIVLEDLHATDEPSVQLLRFLAPDMGDVPLLVLCTLRDVEVRQGSALSALLANLPQNCERLPLRGLAALDVTRLLRRTAGAAVPERIAVRVLELSEGNPLMVGELALQCRSPDGTFALPSSSNAHVPERVMTSVRGRVRQLPDVTQRCLSVASAFGREFSLKLLSALLQRSERQLLADLGPAIEHGLLEQTRSSAGARLSFSHALVRDALYAALTPAERVELHGKIGEVLEKDESAGPRSSFELAHHFFLAAPAGSFTKAADYSLEAARRAENMLAHGAAARLYDQALELAEAEGASERVVYDRLLAAGDAWSRAGEVQTATDRCATAARLARDNADIDGFGRAIVRYTRAAYASMWQDRRFVELVQEALPLLPPGDSVVKAMMLSWSTIRVNALAPKEMRERAARESLDMARRIDDPFAIVSVVSSVCFQLAGVVRPEETRKLANELIEVSRAIGDDTHTLAGLQRRLADNMSLADFGAARADFEEFCALAESGKHAAPLYWARVNRAYDAERTGKFEEAERLAEEAYRWGERIQEPWAARMYAVQRMHLDFDRGRSADISGPLALAFPEDTIMGRMSRLILAIVAGEYESAHAIYAEVAADGFKAIPEDRFQRALLSSAVYYAYLIGDRSGAEALYALLSPSADLAVTLDSTLYYAGPVSRLLALLCVCLGDSERAVDYFEDAIAQCQHAGARPRLADTLCEYAKLLLSLPGTERKQRGAEVREHARTIADELGMTHISAQTRLLAE